MVTVESASMNMLPPRTEAELLMNFESSTVKIPLWTLMAPPLPTSLQNTFERYIANRFLIPKFRDHEVKHQILVFTSGREANCKGEGANPLFCPVSPQNCMKMKTFAWIH